MKKFLKLVVEKIEEYGQYLPHDHVPPTAKR
ncbi:Uncharacterised protein [Lederbergia lenta]|uniref:Uncharacterized protein n=1 Tax=Lederbergia lenta TaxID=1467 RepID=A0A2X4W4V2_LEDLE|nr:Uncharacterised protein [Lederbergia lenta]